MSVAANEWPHGAVQWLGAPLSAAAADQGGGSRLTASKRTLVLYDTSGDYGWAGELNAAALGTLVSHFGPWDALPVAQYSSGILSRYAAVVYQGTTSDELLSAAFLQDVAAATIPVLWIDANLDQLVRGTAGFAERFGFAPDGEDNSAIASISYKGVSFTRDASNGSGIARYGSLGAPAVTLASALRSDGSPLPWAIRSGNLFYIGEDPLAYISSSDRYLVLCDLLFDLLAPGTPERHRALVRIEDVSAQSDAGNLRQLADYLVSQNVPFSVATIPQYLDPLGAYNAGQPVSLGLHEAPALVDALDYMAAMGGKLIMHGYTHQYQALQNPSSGVSADDFEFYRAQFDAQQVLHYDGPVAEDSAAWAAQRFQAGLAEFASAGLARPDVFEWPHYWGSVADAQALKAVFDRVYQHVVYFPGILSGAAPRYDRNIEIFLPYTAHDAYGFDVIPENLDHYTPDAGPDRVKRTAEDILADAKRNLAVRDGFASFFFHNYLTVDDLAPIITGLKELGYEFVSVDQVRD